MVRPILIFGAILTAGITAGRYYGAPCDTVVLLAVTLFLFALSALLRSRALPSMVTLCIGAFTMGLFLITNADEQNPEGKQPYRHSRADDMNAFETFMLEQRQKLSDVYRQQGIEGDSYAIVAAMTLGEKDRVGKDLKEAYVASGAAHVFALSGLHLSVIFILLSYLLPVRKKSRWGVVVQMLLLWTYVALVGMHPSILRAAIMLSGYSICKLLSRAPESIDVLLFTAFVIVCFKPQWLFDVGFQMSFMAVLSIVLLYSRIFEVLPVRKRYYAACDELEQCRQMYFIEERLYGTRRWMTRFYLRFGILPITSFRHLVKLIKKGLWRTLMWSWAVFVVSFTAQLGVLPLIAHYFHRVSTYGLVVNFVVSPATMFIISLAFCLFLLLLFAAVVSFLPLLSGGIMIVAGWCAVVINSLVTFLNNFLSAVSHLPYASIDGVQYSTTQTILTYVLIASVALFIAKWRRYRKYQH